MEPLSCTPLNQLREGCNIQNPRQQGVCTSSSVKQTGSTATGSAKLDARVATVDP